MIINGYKEGILKGMPFLQYFIIPTISKSSFLSHSQLADIYGRRRSRTPQHNNTMLHS